VSFLADLFVQPGHQSAGLGQRLLEHVLPRQGPLRCCASSADPRALGLYIRWGMRPRWPLMHLLADPARLRAAQAGIEVVEARPGDPELVEWDAEIGGRARPQDHAYWVTRRGGMPLWLVRGSQTVGYAYAQANGDDLPWRTDVLTLGPLGARRAEDTAACLFAALAWARGRAPLVRLAVPAPSPALGPLVEAGARIAYADTFCLSDGPEPADFRRYVPSGADLF
jgi:hypothetical protein